MNNWFDSVMLVETLLAHAAAFVVFGYISFSEVRRYMRQRRFR